ncbi:MAG: thioredoxin family protein [Candidatus Thiodiazotropha sp.]|jgi:small redox-active disulfide protein 2
MKVIKVLGGGCRSCVTTHDLIAEVLREKGIEAELTKVEDMGQIMGYGVMSTPGVVIDEQVVHSGGIPERKLIESWF